MTRGGGRLSDLQIVPVASVMASTDYDSYLHSLDDAQWASRVAFRRECVTANSSKSQLPSRTLGDPSEFFLG